MNKYRGPRAPIKIEGRTGLEYIENWTRSESWPQKKKKNLGKEPGREGPFVWKKKKKQWTREAEDNKIYKKKIGSRQHENPRKPFVVG